MARWVINGLVGLKSPPSPILIPVASFECCESFPGVDGFVRCREGLVARDPRVCVLGPDPRTDDDVRLLPRMLRMTVPPMRQIGRGIGTPDPDSLAA